MGFDWYDTKAAVNAAKHGVTFEEAKSSFSDPNAIEFFDADHSDDESRFINIGMSSRGRLLLVVFTEREANTIWIISARVAEAKDVRAYEENQ